MSAVTMTNYDPTAPKVLKEEDCLQFAGKKWGIVMFHKDSGYFYFSVNLHGKAHYRCACRQFMSNHHLPVCENSITELEMLEECRVYVGYSIDHNHPPPSRSSVELMLFRWQAQLMHIQNAKTMNGSQVVDAMYPTWPFCLPFSKPRLKELFRKSLAHSQRVGVADKHGEGKKLVEQLGQEKIDAMKSFLMISQEYWGPPLPLDDRARVQAPPKACCGKITKKFAKRKRKFSEDVHSETANCSLRTRTEEPKIGNERDSEEGKKSVVIEHNQAL